MKLPLITLAVLLLTLLPALRADNSPSFEPSGGSALDKAAFTQWVDGKETPIAEDAAKGGPAAVMWTAKSKPDWPGVKFGDGRDAGVRHLRVGFAESIAVGSVLVRGGGVLSVLKADAAYPGNMADEAQWMAAERLADGVVSRKEVDNEGYALWVLPPGTKTRALRFSHSPSPGDREMTGWLGGVWILEQRFGNVAPQALAQSSARDDVSARLVDESNNRSEERRVGKECRLDPTASRPSAKSA